MLLEEAATRLSPVVLGEVKKKEETAWSSRRERLHRRKEGSGGKVKVKKQRRDEGEGDFLDTPMDICLETR